MSKSRYLKASELGIPHKELRAFIWVKNLLSRGVLETGYPENKPFKFDITETVEQTCDVRNMVPSHWCGTAACIGGWVGLKLHAADPFRPTDEEMSEARRYVSHNFQPYKKSHQRNILFYANLKTKANPVEAAKAVEEYLTTGKGR